MKKLTLGTVQFGLDYGINNFTGKPSLEKSLKILKTAYDSGITSFDTAAVYGNAEEILGKFIETNNLNGKVEITTKLRPNIFDQSDLSIDEVIENEVNSSLSTLKIDKLHAFLLHTPEYVYNDELLRALTKVKALGLVDKIGVSIYDQKEALYAAQNHHIDHIQIPYSILDQRLHKTDFFKLSKENNKEIYGRSCFIQGLLFMNKDKVPKDLHMAVSCIEKLEILSKDYDLSIAALSILFSKGNNNLDSIVFGVDNLEQLSEDLDIWKSDKNLDLNQINSLKEEFNNVESYIVIPSLWKK